MPTRVPPRAASAAGAFRRALVYLVVAGVAMVTAALFYLTHYGPLTPMLVAAVVFGVFSSVVLGGGLMAAGFFSADSGHDDQVAGAQPSSIENS